MKKYLVTLERAIADPFPRNNTLGTDALNALSEIPGLLNIEIELESENLIRMTFEYDSENSTQFLEANVHLLKFGLQKINQ